MRIETRKRVELDLDPDEADEFAECFSRDQSHFCFVVLAVFGSQEPEP